MPASVQVRQRCGSIAGGSFQASVAGFLLYEGIAICRGKIPTPVGVAIGSLLLGLIFVGIVLFDSDSEPRIPLRRNDRRCVGLDRRRRPGAGRSIAIRTVAEGATSAFVALMRGSRRWAFRRQFSPGNSGFSDHAVLVVSRSALEPDVR